MTGGSRIGWPLRAWLIVEIGFGLAAISSIGLDPANTATNFAWPIKPEIMAALLGAFYVASAGLFLIAAAAGHWQAIRIAVVPAILFTFTELLATFLHWEKFSVGTTPFHVWFASYVLPPPILAACYVWQQGRATAPSVGRPLARPIKLSMLALGFAVTLAGLVAFVRPDVIIASAPWQVTPLTSRALSGWLLALGTMLLFAARENDRDRMIVLSPFFMLLGPCVIFQLGRFSDQADWTHPTIWIGGVMLVAVFLIGLYAAAGDWRSYFRRPAAQPEPAPIPVDNQT